MREERSFPPAPESVAAARRFTIHALGGASDETLELVELLVSELATNAFRHAGSRFDIAVLQSAGEIRVEVTDYGAGEPNMRQSAAVAEAGRGLRIVDALAASWGFEPLAGRGKTVWFTISSNAGSDLARQAARGRQRPLGKERTGELFISLPLKPRPPLPAARG
jgi:anti-sigma regulatory factor (Ser/Thr protein kinase)